jgi:hypothetical protein
MRHDFTRAEIDERFEALERLLQTTPLPTERGGTRTASADEFMLMHEHAGPLNIGKVVGFKHRDTRNYAFLIYAPVLDGDAPAPLITLHVPRTSEPFMMGFFDVFEMPAGWQSVGTSVPAHVPEEDPRCD